MRGEHLATIPIIALGGAPILAWGVPKWLGLQFSFEPPQLMALAFVCPAAAMFLYQTGWKETVRLLREYAVPLGLAVLGVGAVALIGGAEIKTALAKADVVDAAAFFAAFAAVLVAIWSLLVNSWISLRNQRVNVRMICIERYDEFALTRPDFRGRDRNRTEKIHGYFRRHWAIKKDQLDLWISGYVDPEALMGWFMSDIRYFSGSSWSLPKVLFEEHWDKVRNAPGSVDERLTMLVERIRNEVVPLRCELVHCPNPECSEPPASCALWQRAALFWLLREFEDKESLSIRSQRANGVGRETFKRLFRHYPHDQRSIIERAGQAIRTRRRLSCVAVEQPGGLG